MTVMRAAPPSLSDLQQQDVHAARVFCVNPKCGHFSRVPFGALALPPETPFPDIVKLRQFVCKACAGREVTLQPDWPAYRPSARAKRRCGGRLRGR
jgi:hypothetical protein